MASLFFGYAPVLGHPVAHDQNGLEKCGKYWLRGQISLGHQMGCAGFQVRQFCLQAGISHRIFQF